MHKVRLHTELNKLFESDFALPEGTRTHIDNRRMLHNFAMLRNIMSDIDHLANEMNKASAAHAMQICFPTAISPARTIAQEEQCCGIESVEILARTCYQHIDQIGIEQPDLKLTGMRDAVASLICSVNAWKSFVQRCENILAFNAYVTVDYGVAYAIGPVIWDEAEKERLAAMRAAVDDQRYAAIDMLNRLIDNNKKVG